MNKAILLINTDQWNLPQIPAPVCVNCDELPAALLGVLLNARHNKIINTHAVGQPDALVFQRHVVVVVMTAEHGLAAQLTRTVKQAAGVIGAADLVYHLFSVLPEEIRHFIAARLIKLVSRAVLLQRDIKTRVVV